jgi:hypothetical protein
MNTEQSNIGILGIQGHQLDSFLHIFLLLLLRKQKKTVGRVFEVGPDIEVLHVAALHLAFAYPRK